MQKFEPGTYENYRYGNRECGEWRRRRLRAKAKVKIKKTGRLKVKSETLKGKRRKEEVILFLVIVFNFFKYIGDQKYFLAFVTNLTNLRLLL